MDTGKKKSVGLYAIVFIVLIVVLGVLNIVNLADNYISNQVDYSGRIADLGKKIEGDVAGTFYQKFQFVNLNGAARRLLGQREMKGVIKLDNGHLIMPQKQMSRVEIEYYATEVIKYADFVKSQGKLLLFVQPILNVDEDNKQLPTGIEDYSNENIDLFLEILTKADIDILDIRESMRIDGLDMYDYTYVTDHHWTTIGCFYSFTKIAEWITQHTEVEIDARVTDLDCYEIETYPKWHLGSYGQRVGQYFAGIDDYELILPVFDVVFDDGTGLKSTFVEQAVDTGVFEKKDITSRYTYDFALQCPKGVANTSAKMKVLMLSDSYSTGMAPYIKIAYSEYLFSNYFDGFSTETVLQYDPDIVILMPFETSTFHSGAVLQQ